jgi:hypothetical protein
MGPEAHVHQLWVPLLRPDPLSHHLPDAEESDEDETGLIEDASDLGEDDDDMAEVMEHMDEEIGDEV